MPKRIFFFSDIDDTLIQTKRKTDFNKNTVVGSYTKDGEENSFFYEGTKVFIDTIIKSGMNLVPTTARNLDSYKRTIFYKNKDIKYVILNFGGLIINENQIDEQWSDLMTKKYNEIESLDTIHNRLTSLFNQNNLNLEVKTIDNYYISIYNRANLGDTKTINKTRASLENFIENNDKFYLYENDNSFGVLPNFLNKKFAVDYLIEKYSPILTIGAGDNISDLDFMKSTTFKLLPDGFKI
jgi:hypothetical protein